MRIRVDKLPYCCEECAFIDHFVSSKCRIVKKADDHPLFLLSNSRRDDCPLIDDRGSLGGKIE